MFLNKFKLFFKKVIFNKRIITFIIKNISKDYNMHNYRICCMDNFPNKLKQLQYISQNMKDSIVTKEGGIIAAVTAPYRIPMNNYNGIVYISLNAIQQYIFKSSVQIIYIYDIIKRIILHELYHSEQFEFLRKKGGYHLITIATTDQKDVPYENNIFEKSAYKYQNTGIRDDLEIVFAKYL